MDLRHEQRPLYVQSNLKLPEVRKPNLDLLTSRPEVIQPTKQDLQFKRLRASYGAVPSVQQISTTSTKLPLPSTRLSDDLRRMEPSFQGYSNSMLMNESVPMTRFRLPMRLKKQGTKTIMI